MISLTHKQRLRKEIIIECLQKKMTNKTAASQLHISLRQFYNIKKNYLHFGDKSLIHGNTGRKPVTTISQDIKTQIIKIASSWTYENTTYQYLKECLEEDFNIHVSKTSLSTILKSSGIKSPWHRKKKKREIHPHRPRRDHMGELIQADASPYDWLSTGHTYALHGFVDDATGIPTGLYLTEHECLMGYNQVLKQTLLSYGIPQSLYPDRSGIFFLPDKERKDLTFDEQLAGKTGRLTQFGQIAEHLGIDMFPASTPQAKGRIERSWLTHKYRLPIWFKRRNIKTIEEANKALPLYIAQYIQKFGKKPKSSLQFFVPLSDKQKSTIDSLLVSQYKRHTDKGGAFSLFNYQFGTTVYNKDVIIKCSHTSGIWLEDINGKKIDMWLIEDSETDTKMPKVLQELIYKVFMADGKKYRPPVPEHKRHRRRSA